mgnify:FL=1
MHKNSETSFIVKSPSLASQGIMCYHQGNNCLNKRLNALFLPVLLDVDVLSKLLDAAEPPDDDDSLKDA